MHDARLLCEVCFYTEDGGDLHPILTMGAIQCVRGSSPHLRFACSNGRLIGPLLDAADDMKPGTARLLRLLCRPLFHARMYTQRVRIARGAYAEARRTNPATLQEAAEDSYACSCWSLPTIERL